MNVEGNLVMDNTDQAEVTECLIYFNLHKQGQMMSVTGTKDREGVKQPGVVEEWVRCFQVSRTRQATPSRTKGFG